MLNVKVKMERKKIRGDRYTNGKMARCTDN